jgi:hypothetical protein
VTIPRAIVAGTTNRSLLFIWSDPSFLMAGGLSRCMWLANTAKGSEFATSRADPATYSGIVKSRFDVETLKLERKAYRVRPQTVRGTGSYC